MASTNPSELLDLPEQAAVRQEKPIDEEKKQFEAGKKSGLAQDPNSEVKAEAKTGKLVPSEDLDLANVSTKPPPRQPVDPTYRGWKEVGRWGEEDALTEMDEAMDSSHTSLLDAYLPAVAYGDWYHNVGYLAGGGILSWILGWFRFSLAPVFFVMVVFAMLYRTSIKKYRSVLRDQAQREFAIKAIENDYETMDWLNAFLEKFWYFLEPSVAQIVCEQANPILAASPAPAFIKKLWIDSFTAGTKPPRIDCVKTLAGTNDDVVVMDWGFSFTPNTLDDVNNKQLKNKVNQKVLVKASLFGFDLPVVVSDISFRGLARVRMRMMTSFPHVETVNVTMLEPPEFDFKCKLLGESVFHWEVLGFPGLYPFINEMVKKYVGPMLFSPLSFQLNVQQLMAGNSLDSAVGILAINAKSARGLKGFNYLGNTLDPYLTFGFQKDVAGKTQYKSNTSEPVWNETIYIPVKSLSEPLAITVVDYNDVRKDRQVGAIQFDLEALRDESRQPNISAPFLRNNKPVGELQFGLFYMPCLEAEKLVDGAVIPPPDLNTGIARIQVSEARHLNSKDKAASTYAELYFDNELVLTTDTQKNTNNPGWGALHEKIVYNRVKSKVKVLLRAAKSDKVLGKVNLSLNELLDSTQVEEYWYQIPSGGEIRIEGSWKSVALENASGSGGYTPPKGVLRVSIDGAQDLRNLERIGKVDPYARVLINGFQRGRTAAADSTLNPSWHEVLYVPISSANQKLTIEVMDVEYHAPDRTLGSFDVKLNDVIRKNERGDYIEHVDEKKRESKLIYKKGPKGTVTYSLGFYPVLPVMTLEEIREEEDEKEAARKEREEKAKNQEKEKNGAKESSGDDSEEDDDDDPRSAKLKLPLEELVEYKSGVLIYEITKCSVSKDDVYLQVYSDNHGHYEYRSQKLSKKSKKVGTTGDATIKELDESTIVFKLVKDKEDNRLDKALSEVTIPTAELLKKSFHEPFTVKLEGSANASFEIQSSWVPIIFQSAVPPQDTFKNSGKVRINILRAENLPAADRSGKSDPYIELHLNTEKEPFYKSKKLKKTLNPTWNENTEVKVANIYDSSIKVICNDWDMGPEKDDLLGVGYIPLAKVFEGGGETVEYSVQLYNEEEEESGVAYFEASYTPEVVFNVLPTTSSNVGGAIGQVGKGVGGVGKGVGQGLEGVGKGVGKVLKKGFSLGKHDNNH